MWANLFEAWQARQFNKAEALIAKGRERENQELNNPLPPLKQNLDLTWADLGLRAITTYKDYMISRLRAMGILKPDPKERRRMVYTGDPDNKTKPLRKHFLTQRSTIPSSTAEKSATVFYD